MENNLNNKKKNGNIEVGLIVVSVALLGLFIVLMIAIPQCHAGCYYQLLQYYDRRTWTFL